MAGNTALVREALRRVSVLCMDNSPQFKRFKEVPMVDFLNDAQVAIAKYVPTACARLDTIKLKPGALQSLESIAAADCKPADGSTPAAPILGNGLLKALNNMGTDGLTVGRMVRLIEQDRLDAYDPEWMLASKASATVQEVMYDPADPRHFLVNPPVPSAPAVWLRVSYTAQPLRITDGGAPGAERYKADGSGPGNADKLSIADVFLDDLVNYVVARLNMMDNEWADGNKAAAFTALFVNSINAQATALTGVNPNLQRLPFAPQPVGAAS